MTEATEGRIMVAVEGPVATVRIANPARRNAVSTSMWRALARFAADASHRSDIRVVVLRGEGEAAFCAGADVHEFDGQRQGADAAAYDDLVEGTCRALEAVPQATLAVIRGACMGAGNSIAASCDMRIASHDAYFAHPAARLGLGYDPRGIARLAGVYGVRAVRQLMLFGTRLDATSALALGAIDQVAAGDEMDALAVSLAAQASRGAPLTVRAAKATLRALAPRIDPALVPEVQALSRLADTSSDYEEGLRAFREKREPRFEGR
ncbi:MAG TPA: enoyl-CoA hydratase-related protein [Usitatibacter sp.]|nr:enoyl-CoA hydratase-related protein [Usitatibacter sp.]